MPPAYKLTYFQSKGATASIRFLFIYGGIEFEDNRITRADWPQLKEKAPFGQVPYLEHNGKKVGQSIAILRYVAKLVKLTGKNDWEDLEIDAVVDTLNDLKIKVTASVFASDEERKKVLKNAVVDETIPYYLTRLEALAQKNSGHLALQRLTWADFYFTCISHILDQSTGSDSLSKYPNLTVLREKVVTIPTIKKWLETQPKTQD